LGAKCVGARKLVFFVFGGNGWPCATAGRLCTGQWTGYRRIHRRRWTMRRRNIGRRYVLKARHVYTRIREAGALGGRNAGTGLPTKCPDGRRMANVIQIGLRANSNADATESKKRGNFAAKSNWIFYHVFVQVFTESVNMQHHVRMYMKLLSSSSGGEITYYA